MENSQAHSNKRFIYISTAILIILMLCGRAASYFYSVVQADVTFPLAVVYLMKFVTELIMSTRICLTFALIACAVYSIKGLDIFISVILSVCVSILDFVVWFIIAAYNNLLTSTPLNTSLAISNQILITLFEFVLIILSLILSKIIYLRFSSLSSELHRKKYSLLTAARASAILLAISQLGIGIYNLIDSIVYYKDYLPSYIPSTVGSFIYVTIVYGVIPFVISSIFVKIYAKKHVISSKNK